MIVLSHDYVLQQAAQPVPDVPAIGWHNVVTVDSVAAAVQDVNFPASNLANPATHLEWRSTSSATQYVTVTINQVEMIDYVAVARHNFGSASIAVSVEGLVDGEWSELVEPRIFADDSPLMLRFIARSLPQLRLKLAAGTAAPRAAVMYVGKLLDLERKIYVGHTPLPHGRKTNIVNGMSETGNFLGRIVLGSWRETTVPISLMSPAWYRANLEPFLKVAQEIPFFFAWRPNAYPKEVGYAWFIGDVKPAPAGPSNLIAFDWSLGGIA